MKITKIKTMEHYGTRPLSKVRLFIHQTSKNFMTERFGAPVSVFREEVLPLVKIEQMIASNVKARWCQKAGCSCGCSPGFILDVHPTNVGYEAIWVTVK
jgi:hypothetical protein